MKEPTWIDLYRLRVRSDKVISYEIKLDSADKVKSLIMDYELPNMTIKEYSFVVGQDYTSSDITYMLAKLDRTLINKGF